MLSINSKISGQTFETPCEICTSWTVRGATGNTTDISSLPPITDCTWFRGTILITAPTNWSNLTIRMETGSKIEVQDDLTIDECNIGTCDDLWRGIEISGAGNSIIISNSIISGANIAVELNHQTKYSIYNSEFVNNYIGVSTGSPFESLVTGVVVYPDDGVILGCRFYTDSQLPDPYNGHYYFPAWPSVASIPFNQGYAALYISGSTGLYLGILSPGLGLRNEIFHMRNGVIVRNATTRILSTDFRDFVGSIPKIAALSGILNLNQRGIFMESSVCQIERDTFQNVMKGIESTVRSSQNIVDNYFDIPIQSPIEATRGIELNQPTTSYIAENKIYNGYMGINVTGTGNSFLIEDNSLYRSITAANNAGINLQKLYSLTRDYSVQDNEIDITGGRKAVGISMNDVQSIRILRNDIDFLQTEPLPAGTENAGISGMQVYNSLISENSIHGTSHYKMREKNAGIVMTNSMGNDHNCNQTDDMYFGQWIISMNMMTDLKENEFYDATNGLDLFSPVELGPQEHFFNQWLGSYSGYGAFISGSDPVNTALASPFTVDDISSGGIFSPSSIGPTAIENDWFFFDDSELGISNCTYSPIPPPFTDSLVNIVRHPLVFSDYEDEMNWMRKADMLTFLHHYPAYLSNTVLDSFFDAESTTPLGELIWAQFQMSIVHGLDPDLDETDSLLFVFTAQVRVLDSLIALNPYNVVALKALRVLKIDTLTGHMDDWLGMIDNQSSATEDSLDVALDVVDNVTPANDQESQLQAMLWLKGGYGKGDSLTTVELESVYEMARQCPWLGARALSESQFLYSQIADSIFTHRPGECVELPAIVIEDRSDESGFTNTVQIYPNPANDLLIMHLPDWVESAEIYSLDGKQLKKIQIPEGGRYSLRVSDIPSGIYTIRTRGNQKIENHQILITR